MDVQIDGQSEEGLPAGRFAAAQGQTYLKAHIVTVHNDRMPIPTVFIRLLAAMTCPEPPAARTSFRPRPPGAWSI